MQSKIGTTPIQLRAADDARSVVVTPEDEDRFVVTCRDAVRAVQVHVGEKAAVEELRSMLDYVRERLTGLSQVSACYAAPREGQIVFFVVPGQDKMDFALSESLTELDLELAEKFQVYRCEILQIPSAALGTFLDPSLKVQIYGENRQSRSEVAAQP